MVKVSFTETCVLWQQDGTQCGQPTGMTAEGVDADLCPEHRATMHAQRLANATPAPDRIAALEAQVAALTKALAAGGH